jgi:hypothetical protein
MSWTDRLRRLTSGDPQGALVAELRTLHQRSAERAERFAAYAAQAPTPGAERGCSSWQPAKRRSPARWRRR